MKKSSKFYLVAVVAALVSVTNIDFVSAHRDGCHRWHSCPSDSGGYVCGDLGYTSECPSAAPVYTPRLPVHTTQTITREESIPFKVTTRYDYREYPGFTKIKTPGAPGTRMFTTNISLTDGIETDRTDISNVVTQNPVDQILIKGGRSKPVAKVYGIADSAPGFLGMNKGKFNIWGKYKPNSQVRLFVNKVERSSARSNNDGWFTFNNVRINNNKAWLLVFETNNGRIITLSDKTKVNTKTKTVVTEYELLHPVVPTAHN